MAEFPKETHGLTRPQEELGDKIVKKRAVSEKQQDDSPLSNTKVTNQQKVVKEVMQP